MKDLLITAIVITIFLVLMAGFLYLSTIIPLWVGIYAFVGGVILMGVCEIVSNRFHLPNPGSFFLLGGALTFCLSNRLQGLYIILGTGASIIVLFILCALILPPPQDRSQLTHNGC